MMGQKFYLNCYKNFTGDPNDSQNWLSIPLQTMPENRCFETIPWRYEAILFYQKCAWFNLDRPRSQFDSPIRKWVKETYPEVSFDFYDHPTDPEGKVYDAAEVSYTIQCVLKVLQDRKDELPYEYLESHSPSWVWPSLKIDPTKGADRAEAEILERSCYEACKPSLDRLLRCCEKGKEWKQPILSGWLD